jgi:HK97 family phage major capsid protein
MSKRTDDLHAQVEALRAELTELGSVEEPTDEQVARSDEALAAYEATLAEYEVARARDEKIEAIRSTVVDAPARVERGSFEAPNVNVRKDPFDGVNSHTIRTMAPNDTDVVERALTAVQDVKMRGVSDAARADMTRTIENVPGAAREALVFASPAYRAAFEKWFDSATRGLEPIFDAYETEIVRTAFSLTGSAGGYAVPWFLDPTIVKTGTASGGNLREVARVEQIATSKGQWVTAGNVVSYWTAEASAYTENATTFAQPAITPAKMTAYIPYSYELDEDSDLIGQLPGLIAESFGYLEADAFIAGSGTNAPKGLITAISATAGSTVTATTRGSFTSSSAVDVYAVLNAVPTRYENTATWVANKATFNTVNQMSPSGGGSLYWGDFTSGLVGTRRPLLGSPTFQASTVTSSTTSGNVLAVLGDMSRYLIVDRIGTMVEVIPQVFNNTPLPLGQRAIVAHKRVGGDCLDINAFRFLKA